MAVASQTQKARGEALLHLLLFESLILTIKPTAGGLSINQF
jgi:hypothetical protein